MGPTTIHRGPACNERWNMSAQFSVRSNAKQPLVSSRCRLLRFVFQQFRARDKRNESSTSAMDGCFRFGVASDRHDMGAPALETRPPSPSCKAHEIARADLACSNGATKQMPSGAGEASRASCLSKAREGSRDVAVERRRRKRKAVPHDRELRECQSVDPGDAIERGSSLSVDNEPLCRFFKTLRRSTDTARAGHGPPGVDKANGFTFSSTPKR